MGRKGVLAGVRFGLPVAFGMPQPQNFEGLRAYPVNDQIRSAPDNPFAGVGDVARAADLRMVRQTLSSIPKPLRHCLRGLGIVLGDVGLRLDQIVERRARPPELQPFAPQRAKAARTSSSVAKASRSAARAPASTARRKRAYSITSSQVAFSGSVSASWCSSCLTLAAMEGSFRSVR